MFGTKIPSLNEKSGRGCFPHRTHFGCRGTASFRTYDHNMYMQLFHMEEETVFEVSAARMVLRL